MMLLQAWLQLLKVPACSGIACSMLGHRFGASTSATITCGPRFLIKLYHGYIPQTCSLEETGNVGLCSIIALGPRILNEELPHPSAPTPGDEAPPHRVADAVAAVPSGDLDVMWFQCFGALCLPGAPNVPLLRAL